MLCTRRSHDIVEGMASSDRSHELATPLARLTSKPFVGRAGLLEAARVGIEAAAEGRGQSLVFSGEPGIGKTTLADEMLTIAESLGVLAMTARCHELEGAPALWPWVQIARSALEAIPSDVQDEFLSNEGKAIQSLLDHGAHSDQDALGTLPDRIVVFDAIVGLLSRASREKPLLVLIDDLHWGDPASAMLLRFAVRELRHHAVIFTALYRHTDLVEGDALSLAIEELAGESEAFRVEGLGASEMRSLVDTVVGYDMAGIFHTALIAHTGGNPLFAVEVLRLLISEDRLGSSALAVPDAIPLPSTVRTAIERRLHSLDSADRIVLQQASLLGREFDMDVLNATGIPADRARRAITAGVEAGLLERIEGRRGAIRFAHDVVRESLAISLSQDERTNFSRNAADALVETRASSISQYYARLASLFFESAFGAAGESSSRAAHDSASSYRYAVLGARQAYANYSFEVATQLLELAIRALDLKLQEPADGAPETDERWRRRGEALLLLADARWQSGLAGRAADADREAEQLALRHDDPVLRARAVLGLTGRSDLPLDPPAEHTRWLQEAYEALPKEAANLRLRVLAQQVRSSSFGDLGDEVIGWAEECRRIASSLNDPWADFIAQDAMHYALIPAEHLDARLEIAKGLPGLARELGSSRLEALAVLWRIFDRLQVPDRLGADRDAGRLREIADQLRRPFWQWLSLGVDACLAQIDGDLGRVEKLIFEALEIGQQASTPNAILFFGTQLFHLREAQGRADELLPVMEQIERERPGLPVFRIGIPLIHALAGREEDARRTFDSVASADFRDVPFDFHRLPMLTSCAAVAAYLGDAPRAASLRALLSNHEGRIVMGGVVTHWGGSVDRALGQLHETLGDFAEAERCYEQAVVIAQRAGARLEEAGGLIDLARVRGLRSGGVAGASCISIQAEADAIYSMLGVEHPVAIVPRCEQKETPLPARRHTASTPDENRALFAEGAHTWLFEFEGVRFELPDSKGLHYLHHLLGSPEEDIHVLTLVAARERGKPEFRLEAGNGATGAATVVESDIEAVDPQALRAYRERLRALASDREEAERDRDLSRLDAIDDEHARIEQELRSVTGASGRIRPANSVVEKARKAVYNRVRASTKRIGEHAPDLARHLERTIKTGRTCSYRPEHPIDWQLTPD